MMTDATNILTVEDVRKLALPLGTRVVTGDGLLNRPVSWTTVVYLDDNFNNKTLQQDEMVIVAPPNNPRAASATDVDVVRWAADHVKVPWFAIGGVSLQTIGAVLAAGATRVCVVSAILNSSDVKGACQLFKEAVSNGA